MKSVFFTCLLLIFSVSLLSAQNDKPKKGNKYQRFIKLEHKPNRGQIQQVFKNYFNLRGKDKLKVKKTKRDELGFTHDVYQQYYDGVEVEGATFTAHTKFNQIWHMSGVFIDVFDDLNTSPTLRSSQALVQARGHVGSSDLLSEKYEKMVIIADPEGIAKPRLAYKFDMYSRAPLYRAYVYVDAHTGGIIRENPRIHDADVDIMGTTLYNGDQSITADNTGGSNHRLRQSSDGNGIRTFDLNNGTSYGAATDITDNGLPFNSDPTGVQAHWGAEQTHQYFSQKHSRNSYDDNGAIINSYVHYSSNYVNAFWDGQRMTYGDGDGVNYGPLVSLDIVGHEIAHGVTEYAANLIYSYESGALNESFSDIFGESIENFALGSNDWLMGDDIGIGGSGAIRSMSNPNAFGDPDTYLGTYWHTSSSDYGGVHTNSGVQNKWFYILSEGESGTNDNGDSYSVASIGIDAAAAIAYRNLTVYLSANSNYFDARAGALQAARDLYGDGSAEEIATANAWYAVGVGGPYGSLSYCSSQGNSVYYEWIAGVTVGSFSNSSSNSLGGYSDFTSQTINVNEGQSYNVSLAPGFRSTIYNEYWKIWIDYNTDGDFSDAGELAFDGGGLTNTTETGTINIPSGLNGTSTRMRVSMKWNASQTECESFSYGEVEDYTIDIGGGGGTIPVTGVNVTPSSLALTTGGSGNLSATVSPGNATDPSVSWSSSNTSVATVNSSGVVTAVSAGSATITATTNDGGFTDNSIVTVTNPGIPVTGVSVSPSSATRDVGQTVQLSANVSPSNASNQSVSWSSSNNSVATVNSNGLVSAVSAGSATITATTVDGGFTDNSFITVNAANVPVTGVSVSPSALSLTAGGSGNLTATVSPGNATNPSVNWSSSNTGVATVNGSGVVTAVSAGSATITATTVDGGFTDASAVTVTAPGECTPVLIDANDFESGWGIWNDGGSDSRRSSSDASYALGTYCVRLRDNTSSSVMTTDNINVSVYDELIVEFSYYPRSMDNSNEDFWLQISTNGGGSYTTVEEWNRNDEFQNDQRYYESVSISGFNLSSNTRLRFRCDASGNSDWVYIDEVSIYGCANSGSLQAEIPVLEEEVTENVNTSVLPPATINDTEVMDMRLFPNPVRSELTIVYSLPQTNSAYLVVADLTGQTLRQEKVLAVEGEQRLQLDVSNMTSGFYFVHLVTNQGRLSKKFVVAN